MGYIETYDAILFYVFIVVFIYHVIFILKKRRYSNIKIKAVFNENTALTHPLDCSI